eukprot:gene432-882_t
MESDADSVVSPEHVHVQAPSSPSTKRPAPDIVPAFEHSSEVELDVTPEDSDEPVVVSSNANNGAKVDVQNRTVLDMLREKKIERSSNSNSNGVSIQQAIDEGRGQSLAHGMVSPTTTQMFRNDRTLPNDSTRNSITEEIFNTPQILGFKKQQTEAEVAFTKRQDMRRISTGLREDVDGIEDTVFPEYNERGSSAAEAVSETQVTSSINQEPEAAVSEQEILAHFNLLAKRGAGHVCAFLVSSYRKKVTNEDRKNTVWHGVGATAEVETAGAHLPIVSETSSRFNYPRCTRLVVRRVGVKRMFNMGKPPRVFLFDFEYRGKKWHVQRLGLDLIRVFQKVHHDLHKNDDAHKKLPKLPWKKLITSKKHQDEVVAEKLQEYMNSVFKIDEALGSEAFCAFVQVSRFSSEAPVTIEGYCSVCQPKRKYGTAPCCGILVCGCNFFHQQWAVVRADAICFADHLSAQNYRHTILFDPDFEIVRSGKKEITMNNGYSKSLRMNLKSEIAANLWEQTIKVCAQRCIWATKGPCESFAHPKIGHQAKLLVDGKAYYAALVPALQAASTQIFISGWMLTADLPLLRPADEHPGTRLCDILHEKAEEGVQIFVSIYKEPAISMNNSSWENKKLLSRLHPNIRVIRHPDHFGTEMVLWWSHHEKLCIIDQTIAFVGGIDITLGRYDFAEHPIMDWKIPYKFPGKDYNNPCIKDGDIDTNHDIEKEWLDRSRFPRMPWHDVHAVICGPAAMDVARSFEHLWNHVKIQKQNKSAQDQQAYQKGTGEIKLQSKIHDVALTLFGQKKKVAKRKEEREELKEKAALANDIMTNPEGAQAQMEASMMGMHSEVTASMNIAHKNEEVIEAEALKKEKKSNRFTKTMKAPIKMFTKKDLPKVDSTPCRPRPVNTSTTTELPHLGNVFDADISSPDELSVTSPVAGNETPTLDKKLSQVFFDHIDVPHLGTKTFTVDSVGTTPSTLNMGVRQGLGVQALRSCGEWSHGLPKECSIYNTYLKLIEESEEFLYIENQFFVTSTASREESEKVIDELFNHLNGNLDSSNSDMFDVGPFSGRKTSIESNDTRSNGTSSGRHTRNTSFSSISGSFTSDDQYIQDYRDRRLSDPNEPIREDRIKIFAQTLTGKPIGFYVRESDTMTHLKAIIQKECHLQLYLIFPASKQKLIWGSKRISSRKHKRKTVKQMGIVQGSMTSSSNRSSARNSPYSSAFNTPRASPLHSPRSDKRTLDSRDGLLSSGRLTLGMMKDAGDDNVVRHQLELQHCKPPVDLT